MNSITQNIVQLRERIARAAATSGRTAGDITLVAVSKTKPASLIREAYNAGQRIFGENYAQELSEKARELADLDIAWHFVGHLQRNKAKVVAPLAACVETIDSLETAAALDGKATHVIDVLIEVNIAGETSKSGVGIDELATLGRGITQFKNLALKGIMIMPPFDPNPEASRPYFRTAREIMARLNERNDVGCVLSELSMGMSHDFEVAIEEGATIIRVGTAIFGER